MSKSIFRLNEEENRFLFDEINENDVLQIQNGHPSQKVANSPVLECSIFEMKPEELDSLVSDDEFRMIV